MVRFAREGVAAPAIEDPVLAVGPIILATGHMTKYCGSDTALGMGLDGASLALVVFRGIPVYLQAYLFG